VTGGHYRGSHDRSGQSLRGTRRCHTAGMENPAPKNPQVNQTWVDDDGVLYVWDGTDWVLYEDLPFFEPDPLYRDR
jgi:hypothetical protein